MPDLIRVAVLGITALSRQYLIQSLKDASVHPAWITKKQNEINRNWVETTS